MPKIGRTNILSEQIYTKEGERLLLTLKQSFIIIIKISLHQIPNLN